MFGRALSCLDQTFFFGAFGVGMLGPFANFAGSALKAPGHPPQQKKYRRPL